MWPSPPALPPLRHLVSGRGGDARELPGVPHRDTGPSVALAGGGRQTQISGGQQQAQGGGILYWSRREETLGQDVSEKI